MEREQRRRAELDRQIEVERERQKELERMRERERDLERTIQRELEKERASAEAERAKVRNMSSIPRIREKRYFSLL